MTMRVTFLIYVTSPIDFSASLYRKPHDERVDPHVCYGYSGTVYVTQKSIWFYSCMLMTCVNMVNFIFKKKALYLCTHIFFIVDCYPFKKDKINSIRNDRIFKQHVARD